MSQPDTMSIWGVPCKRIPANEVFEVFAEVGLTELVTVRSVWIIRPQADVPHFVTCYVN